MIDTIILRLHDLRKHNKIAQILKSLENGTNKGTIIAPANVIEEINVPAFFTGPRERVQMIQHRKTGEVYIRYSNMKKLNHSGHYYLNFFLNYERNFIEFNFSIPKYLYGTNVIMFTEHYWNRDFVFHKNSDLKYNFSKAYSKLISFIDQFFRNEFFGWENTIDPCLLEINRIDLCFNQVFQSKEDALTYLKYQKQIRKKNSRKESDYKSEYDTSIFYKTDHYSFKIYHKGSEFKKRDSKELKKINNIRGYEHFRVNKLQSAADKMLRYEMTIRSSFLSYIFKREIFRKNCRTHQRKYKIYLEVERILDKNDRISKKIGTISNVTSKMEYKESHGYIKIDPQMKLVHKEISEIVNTNSIFCIDVDEYTHEYNSTSNYERYDVRAQFSEGLMRRIGNKFIEFIQEYQIKRIPDILYVEKLIDDYNSDKLKAKQLPKKQMILFYALLKENSWDGILNKNVYSRATVFNYKSRFKKIGITERCVVPYFDYPVCENMSSYHTLVMYGGLPVAGHTYKF